MWKIDMVELTHITKIDIWLKNVKIQAKVLFNV